MNIRELILAGLAGALLVFGCTAGGTGDGSTGTARVSALSAADVDRVDILIDGVIEATLTGGATSVTISDIPVGTYTFSANAYDEGTLPDASDDVLIYQGSAPGVTITEGTPVSVNIILQQLIDIPDPFANDVPIFQSLVYSPASPVVDEDVTLTVVVTDADGDPLTIAWTAVSGTVVPDDQLTVVWTTPSSPNTTPGYALTVTASDGSALAALTVEIPVDFETGDTNVTIKLNNFPLVSDLVPVPTRIDVVPGDDTTSLTLTASDPDGDALEYAWSASGCAGTFSDATATPDFTITDRLGGNTCTLSVEVTDVDASNGNAPYGGSTTAEVTIATGPEVTATGLDCGGNLTCTLSAPGSVLANYYVPTVFNPASETLALAGTLEIECGPEGSGCGCRAAFGSPIGPIAIPSLGNVCIFPTPIDYCNAGTITCEAGTEQNIDFIQQHDISNEIIAGLPAPPRSCNDNAGCRSDCAQYCQNLVPAGYERVENSPACEGFCRTSDIPMCLPDDAVPDGRVECPPDDICDELEGFYGHDDFCGCQCVGTSSGAATGPGQALLNIGYSFTVFLDSNGAPDWGLDGAPCTADDVPDAAVEPNCVPYTTSTATISLPDAGYYSAALTTIPTDGTIVPPAAVGAPFTCGDGVPVSASGARLQGVTATKDSQRWDFATVFTLDCQ